MLFYAAALQTLNYDWDTLILGTHQGAVSHEHLDYYLDEFTFRFNRRKSRSRGKLFYRLVQQAVAVQPAPYKSLVGGTATRATDNHNM